MRVITIGVAVSQSSTIPSTTTIADQEDGLLDPVERTTARGATIAIAGAAGHEQEDAAQQPLMAGVRRHAASSSAFLDPSGGSIARA